METNANFTGGRAASQVDPEELREAAFNLMKQAAGAGSPLLEAFAQVQGRRAERLELAAGALREKYGSKDPDAAALSAMAVAASDLKAGLTTQTERLKRWPRPRPNEWLVFGTVWDKKGAPAPDLTVRLFDKDRKYDDLLGETETDPNGDFSIIYHERDFKETRENLPELYVTVLDVSGKTLYTSLDSIRYQSGRSEYFAIHLGSQRSARAKAPRARTASSPEEDKAKT